MAARMQFSYGHGELSLLWAPSALRLCTLAAMASLFSMRYENNVFAEVWYA